MKLPALFRRQRLWVPTIWTWLLLGLVCGVTARFAFLHLHPFLSPSHSIDAQILVVEGWMPFEELEQALLVYEASHYRWVLTTGGPIDDPLGVSDAKSYAERARRYLVSRGLPSDSVISVPAPKTENDRSFLNATLVRDWIARSAPDTDAVNVLSSGVHTRRSWLLYRMALEPRARVGVIAAEPTTYSAETWWRTSAGAKEVLGESIQWLWTKCFFRPE